MICAELGDELYFDEFQKPLVIPIPLTRARKRERGFNQSELIARELVALENTFELRTDILEKRKETRAQATIRNRAERLNNVVGCFSVSAPSAARGRNIILVDDIYTTGGTMSEARAVLEKAGAQKILACAVAH